MGTKSIFSMVACCALCFGAAAAQESHSPSSLDAALYRSVCERVQAPLVFSTRDTVFALSLPQDEPAEVYVQLTVGKNGKVKEKLTKVHANHIAGYVAPAFVAAAKDLRIDKALLGNLSGKDTSVLLAFPLEYQCVLDTMSKARPEEDLTKRIAIPFHNVDLKGIPETSRERERSVELWLTSYPGDMQEKYLKTPPTRVWYYLAFIKEPQE